MINILGAEGHMVPVAPIQLCHEPESPCLDGHSCVPKETSLPKLEGGSMWSVGHGLPTRLV